MNIGEETTHLILSEGIDIALVISYFDSLPDAEWDKFTMRQERFNAHQKTKTIGALWVEPDYDGEVQELPQYQQHKEYFDELIYKVVQAAEVFYKEELIPVRAMVALLPAHSDIPEHIDGAKPFEDSHRIHVPMINSSKVKFTVDDTVIPMKVGTIVEINNRKMHGVVNNSDKRRLQFICDVEPK